MSEGKLCQLGDFIGRHWGDCVALVMLFTGVGLEVYNSTAILRWGLKLEGIHEMSTALVMTAVGILKLRGNPPKNGNGNGNGEKEKQ